MTVGRVVSGGNVGVDNEPGGAPNMPGMRIVPGGGNGRRPDRDGGMRSAATDVGKGVSIRTVWPCAGESGETLAGGVAITALDPGLGVPCSMPNSSGAVGTGAGIDPNGMSADKTGRLDNGRADGGGGPCGADEAPALASLAESAARSIRPEFSFFSSANSPDGAGEAASFATS
jgi:hypothetical protein